MVPSLVSLLFTPLMPILNPTLLLKKNFLNLHVLVCLLFGIIEGLDNWQISICKLKRVVIKNDSYPHLQTQLRKIFGELVVNYVSIIGN